MTQTAIPVVTSISDVTIDQIHLDAYLGFIFRFSDMGYETLYYAFMDKAPEGSKIDIELISPASELYANYGENTVVVSRSPEYLVSIEISVAENPIGGGLEALFTALAENVGEEPVYIWKVNGEGVGNALNATTHAYIPADGDVVTCEVTSALPGAYIAKAVSNAITMIVLS